MDLLFNSNAVSAFTQLEDLNVKYEKKYGVLPFNVSYWDPSIEVANHLLPYLYIKYPDTLIDYKYTYLLPDLKYSLLKKLGFCKNVKDCIFTSNGTQSLMMTIHFIRHLGYSHINVLNPSYFSIRNNIKNEGIEIEDLYFGAQEETCWLERKNQVFWLTNPLYSTGIYLDKKMIDKIAYVLQNNLIICDECVAAHGRELGAKLGNHPNFIGVYAPHKSLCVNGIKFSCIVFNSSQSDFFDECTDYMSGGLNTANIAALKHFLSPHYQTYQRQFSEIIESAHEFIYENCRRSKKVRFPSKATHYLMSIYFPNIIAQKGFDKDFLWKIINRTGASFIPGTYNKFPESYGFCFRINLARDSPQFRASIIRLISYISSI